MLNQIKDVCAIRDIHYWVKIISSLQFLLWGFFLIGWLVGLMWVFCGFVFLFFFFFSGKGRNLSPCKWWKNKSGEDMCLLFLSPVPPTNYLKDHGTILWKVSCLESFWHASKRGINSCMGFFFYFLRWTKKSYLEFQRFLLASGKIAVLLSYNLLCHVLCGNCNLGSH